MPTKDLAVEIRSCIHVLEFLREDVEAMVHLGGEQGNDYWRALEPRVAFVEQEALRQPTSGSYAAAATVAQRLAGLRLWLTQSGAPWPHATRHTGTATSSHGARPLAELAVKRFDA